LVHHRVLQVLHNPRYAGAFFHGRTRQRKRDNGHTITHKLPVEEWYALLPETHPGYITWDQYQQHQQRLRENAQAHGHDRRHSPAGEGPALLQGVILCGSCGQRMTVRYHTRVSGSIPSYVCQRAAIEQGQPPCQVIPGENLDDAVGKLLLEMMTPMTLDVVLAVQEELQTRLAEADRLRRQQVERARYEADLAQQRFMQVDPKNRLVADALEADWNNRLRALADAEECYQLQCQADRIALDQKSKEQILALATDFPRLWRDPKTAHQDRKRMVRLLIEDVTLIKTERITAHVRFKGGATHTLTMPLPLPAYITWQTSPEVVALIDRLLDKHTDGQIALLLNEQGRRSGKGRPFTRLLVGKIRRGYQLQDRYQRLRQAGMLTQTEIAEKIGIRPSTVPDWRRSGLLNACPYNDKNEYLYMPVGANGPRKCQGIKRTDPRRFRTVVSDATIEVQDEA
jgi:hypothetical protein